MKKVYSIIPLIFLNVWVFSQQGFTTYPNPTGYLYNQLLYTSGLAIDASNNKWVAYDSIGLGKFDGSTWTIFNTGNSQIPSNQVTSLFVNKSNIYAGTINGLGIFNGSSTWTIYNTSNGLPDNHVNVINYKSGDLWIGTNNGLARYNGSIWTYFSTQNSSIANDTITSIEFAGADTLWIGTQNGLSCLNNNAFINYFTSNSGLNSNNITCLKKDINNNLWIGTKTRGAYKMSANVIKPLTTLFLIPASNNTLYISSIGLDNNEILILGCIPKYSRYTYPCIFKINLIDSSYYAYLNEGGSFESPYFICTDTNKIIWLESCINVPPFRSYLKSFNCLEGVMSDNFNFLSINNVKARINAGGLLFWDFGDSSKYEVPKGSKKTSIFSGALWVGGKDSSRQLHIAAEEYETYGKDYFPGPIMDSLYYSLEQEKWNRVWKVEKTDVDYLKAHYMDAGYVAPNAIADWPAIGDTTHGEAYHLAPFFDNNGDGKYNPYDGDYPLIKGDEAILFIMNDARNPHTESGGNRLGIQVIAMAYAFDCSEDSAFWNTIFINYNILNCSSTTYDSTFIGNFTDTDIGYANDDYIGCDISRSSFYGYNGKNVDGSGQLNAYGAHPPAQSVTILAGPYLDSAQVINNPSGQCNASVDGFGFGDSINTNERYGMTKFIFFNRDTSNIPAYSGDPADAGDYYNYLTGKWKDSTKMLWGGYAHKASHGVCGPECNFMFPAETDPCEWNTGGQPPNCTPNWSESVLGDQYGDRRGFGSSGPFTFLPGSVEQLDLAFVFGRNFTDTNATAAIPVMQQRIDSIRKYFKNGTTPCGSFTGITPRKKLIPQLSVYPNPTDNELTIECQQHAVIEILNIQGQLIKTFISCGNKSVLNVSLYPCGMYFVKEITDDEIAVKKFIKE